MVALEFLAAGAGLAVTSSAFFRLAESNDTDELYLRVLEYGFAVTLLLAGLGLVAIELVG